MFVVTHSTESSLNMQAKKPEPYAYVFPCQLFGKSRYGTGL